MQAVDLIIPPVHLTRCVTRLNCVHHSILLVHFSGNSNNFPSFFFFLLSKSKVHNVGHLWQIMIQKTSIWKVCFLSHLCIRLREKGGRETAILAKLLDRFRKKFNSETSILEAILKPLFCLLTCIYLCSYFNKCQFLLSGKIKGMCIFC